MTSTTQAEEFEASLAGGSFWMTADPGGPDWGFSDLDEARRWIGEFVERRDGSGDTPWLPVTLHCFPSSSGPQGQPTRTLDTFLAEIAGRFLSITFSDESSCTFEAGVTYPSIDDGADRRVGLRAIAFVRALDDPERLDDARAAIELMQAELAVLLERHDLSTPDAEAAALLRKHLLDLYRMESPPPVAVVDGTLTESARLVHKYRDRNADAQLIDAQIDIVLTARPAGEGGPLAVPLGDLLTEAGRAQQRLRGLARLTKDGATDGYKKLVSTCVVAAPVLALEGVGWLLNNRSYVGVLLRWLQGVVA